MSIIQMILKEFGHIFTILTVLLRRRQLLSLNMEMMKSKPSLIKLLIQKQDKFDSFWEAWTIIDIQHLMGFSPKYPTLTRRGHS